MKSDTMNLNELPLNDIGIIKNVKCYGSIKRRLLDMGLVKGTNVIPVLVSPSKDPRAYQIRGSIIAIRREDAENIEIYK